MLLSGEAGHWQIPPGARRSKSRLAHEGATRIEFRCSPYHQNSAFYPIIEHLQRLLQFEREDPPQAKFTKLQQTLATYRFPQADTLPLLATLLSLPQPEGAPPLTLSPQKQKQKTQEALVAWIVEEAERLRCTVPGKICTGPILPRLEVLTPRSRSGAHHAVIGLADVSA